MNNVPDKNKMYEVLKKSGPQGQKAAEALKNGQLESILASVSPAEAEKIKAVLSDKEAAKMVLNSPQGKKIIQQFFGGGNNG